MRTSTLAVSSPERAAPVVAHPVARCPACDGLWRTVLHRVADPSGRIPGRFTLWRCARCTAVYVDPRPTDDTLTRLYDREFYFSTGWHYDRVAEWVLAAIQASRRARVERSVAVGRLLDVGCGDGRFVHHMARHGWEATGLDFSPAALAFARRRPSRARFVPGTLEDYARAGEPLDAITMWQVLEHLGEPRPVLERCHDLLRPGGLLIAAVPNVDGWSARLTGSRWWGLDVPRHLVLYSPAALRRVLEVSGFEVIRIRHRSFQYDPYALLHSSLDWVFTRRHFLSDFAKRLPRDGERPGDFVRDLAALVTLAPVLAPLSLAVTSLAACAGRGGFMEAHARRR